MKHEAYNMKHGRDVGLDRLPDSRVSSFKFQVSMSDGFTLYEILIYLSLFLMLSVLIVGLVVQLLTGGYKSARSREVVSSVAVALDAMLYEGKFARSVYAPTSVFNSGASQLSLRTAVNPPAGESETFVDFYLDNGKIFMKREGESAKALTGERVLVDRFYVARLNPVSTSESLRVAIAAHHRFSRGLENDAFAATTTVTLRRY